MLVSGCRCLGRYLGRILIVICIICGPFNLVLAFGCDKKAKLEYPWSVPTVPTKGMDKGYLVTRSDLFRHTDRDRRSFKLRQL